MAGGNRTHFSSESWIAGQRRYAVVCGDYRREARDVVFTNVEAVTCGNCLRSLAVRDQRRRLAV